MGLSVFTKRSSSFVYINNVYWMSQAEDNGIPLFVSKLFQMLQCTDHSSIIEWEPEKKGFRIKNIRHLENRVLPKYFRHSNYTSFVRQLNMYDFHKLKIVGEDGLFAHMDLPKLQKDMLHRIKRKCYKRYSNKENTPTSRPTVRFMEPLKSVSAEDLIDQLVQNVREEVANTGSETRKVVYQLRKSAKYREIKGSKYLSRIYEGLQIERKDTDLQELSIEEVIEFEDKIVSVHSLAYVRSEAMFLKAETEEDFGCV